MKHAITAEERMIDELIYLCRIEHEKRFTYTEFNEKRELLKQNILNSVIPLSVIDNIQAEAEKGCGIPTGKEGEDIYECSKKEGYCDICFERITICKKIKGDD